ncbi:TIGR03943 family putative permease subunit [Paenibacillus eucommiae]|uniref:Repeat protein (TIGR03943 family) n=1 Tax=Paenibacillus eucommiae TaxID=1355755 RepID=A0ABS4IY96_9BACL|nr:TIGR03943 family protein [Paenibacillus eucommiae]MBP1992503.1 putative repeat protein (TIGR03943 family) [Paenibacillus eucommiae]
MNEERSLTFHYFFRAAILLGFSIYIIYLSKSGNLMYYIAPRMESYVKYAAVALFVIAAYQVFLAIRTYSDQTEACDCEHVPPRSFWRNFMIYGLFLFPLLLGFSMPDAIMGSDIAAVKGMNLSSNIQVKAPPTDDGSDGSDKLAAPKDSMPTDSSQSNVLDERLTEPIEPTELTEPIESTKFTEDSSSVSVEDEKLKALFVADKYTEDFAKLGMRLYKKELIQVKEEGFMELLTAVDLFKDNFVGKAMEIEGFVYREDNMGPNQFVVSRLAMQCCSADAEPYGVLVESSLATGFLKDTWVKIKGTIGKTTYNEMEIMKLDAVRIEKIEKSETPYVYPYFDDFDTLE